MKDMLAKERLVFVLTASVMLYLRTFLPQDTEWWEPLVGFVILLFPSFFIALGLATWIGKGK